MRCPPYRLRLVPVNPESGLDSIVVEEFPFLIGRIGSHFEAFWKRFPESIRTLSRQHAQITCDEHRFYLQDLGSTNGTYLSGRPLADDHLEPLSQGDQVVFGSFFIYRVNLEPLDNELEHTIASAGPEQSATVNAKDLSDSTSEVPPTEGDRHRIRGRLAQALEAYHRPRGADSPPTDIHENHADRVQEQTYQKLIDEGNQRRKDGDLQAALTVYRRALAIKPDASRLKALIENCEQERQRQAEVQVKMTAGQQALQKGDFQAAISAFEGVLELDANSAEARQWLAHAKTENDAQKWVKRGDDLLEADHIEDAMENFDRALKLKPRDESIRARLEKAQQVKALEDRIGVLIDKAAMQLADGDYETAAGVITEAFALQPQNKVQLARMERLKKQLTARQPRAESVVSAEESLGGQTIHLDSPDRFLRALSKRSSAKMLDEAEAGSLDELEKEERRKSKMPRWLKPIMVLRAAADLVYKKPEQAKLRKRGLIAITLAIVALISIWALVARSPEHKIERLLQKGHYRSGLILSDKALAKAPHNEKLRTLATAALLKHALGGWVPDMNQKHYQAARDVLTEAAGLSRKNPDGQIYLEFLAWSTNLDQYFHEHQSGKKLVIYRDETAIASLNQKWDANTGEYRFVLDQLAGREDAFVPIRERVFRELNWLKTTVFVDLKAVEQLKTDIQAALDSGKQKELPALLDDFEAKFPEVGGIDLLRKDLSSYIVLHDAIEAKRILEVAELLDSRLFVTPLFVAKLAQLRKTALPPPAQIDAYKRAALAWKAGMGPQAVALLEPLGSGEWDAAATAQIAHYQRVLERIAELEKTAGTAAHGPLLLSLYKDLKRGQDDFYIQRLEKELQAVQKEQIDKFQHALASATRNWKAYQQYGGISGLLRLENKISTMYRQQAARLRAAAKDVKTADRLSTLLGQKPSSELDLLKQKVTEEVDLQLLRLKDLEGILDPNILSAKLDLLPEP